MNSKENQEERREEAYQQLKESEEIDFMIVHVDVPNKNYLEIFTGYVTEGNIGDTDFIQVMNSSELISIPVNRVVYTEIQ